MEYQYKRTRIDKLTRDEMLAELIKAAGHFDYIEFGWRDFNKVASISASPIKREFGSWKKALNALDESLRKNGQLLSPRTTPPNRVHSDSDMFAEMERIWNKIGHRPSRTEWENSQPVISYGTYKQRFGGWEAACLKFIEFKMGKTFVEENKRDEVRTPTDRVTNTVSRTRNIPLNIRLKVLSRDNFRCVYCGRSPATDIGVQLHIDHIQPFSKEGGSEENNLQTLCQECNLGKSDQLDSLSHGSQ